MGQVRLSLAALFLIILGAVFAHSPEHASFLGDKRMPITTPGPLKPYSFAIRDTATLTASPDSIDDGQTVTVSWSGLDAGQNIDVIAVYCPYGSNNNPSDYLDTKTIGSQNKGSGSVTFSNLINMRCNYGFRYLRLDAETTILAESGSVTMRAGLNAPMHGRIALTGKSDEMRIMWTSNAAGPNVVRFGLQPGQYTHEVSGTNTTYTADMMCGLPSTLTAQQYFRNPGLFHDVLLTGLQPNTYYYYVFGSVTENLWSEEQTFRSAKIPSGSTGVRFVAYGDMGVDSVPRGMTTMERISEESSHTDFLLHFGDISYARGLGYVWEQFFHILEPISQRIPYMVSSGNHEYDHETGADKDPSGAGLGFHPTWGNYGDDSNGECSVPMYYRWHMPDNGKKNFWYSFDFGNIHILQMSTEHNYTRGSEQYEWIAQDLAQVDRSLTPFVVITGHRPMYTSENCTDDPRASDFPVAVHMREEFEDLLYKFKVDLGLWGHQHSYERSCPVYQEHCVSDGTVHIVVGTAGAGLEGGEFNLGNAKEWSKFTWVDWGYLRVTSDEKQLRTQLIANSDGSIVDEVFVPRKF